MREKTSYLFIYLLQCRTQSTMKQNNKAQQQKNA